MYTKIRLLLLGTFTAIFVSATTLLHAQTIPITPEQIDTIASKNDRWLFVATLVVLLLFCAAVIHILVKQNEKLADSKNNAQKEFTDYLKTATGEHASVIRQNSVILEKNTASNQELTHTINKLIQTPTPK